jgi:hypothetical protein|tara:strand:- start:57 stop:347 length:291 start_codon:yes stop_codon:yes gene_type:complete
MAKCPCIREAMRKKYGENHIACCSKQETSTTPSDIIKKGMSTVSSILNSATRKSNEPKAKYPKELRGPNWNPKLSKGGSVTTKWTRNTSGGSRRCK